MSQMKQSGMKKYFLEFGGAMMTYVVTLFAVIYTRPHIGSFQYLELLPAVPLIFGFWAIIRQYKRSDEFYQRVHSEAFALGGLTLGLFVMIWGFGENAGFPELGSIWIAPALIGLWGICIPIVMRRYK